MTRTPLLGWRDGQLRLRRPGTDLFDTTLDLVQAIPQWAPGYDPGMSVQNHTFGMMTPVGPRIVFLQAVSHN